MVFHLKQNKYQVIGEKQKLIQTALNQHFNSV